jgi:hypothetical protein
VKEYSGCYPAWRFEEVRIPDIQKLRGKTNLTTAYLPHNERAFNGFSKKKSTKEIVEVLKNVRVQYPNTKLYLILDNHRMHMSKEFKRFKSEEHNSIKLG